MTFIPFVNIQLKPFFLITLFYHSRYSSIRNQSDKLLELLELPSLMREALNAEDYESALDIFTFVRNLSKRYSEIPIVQVSNFIFNIASWHFQVGVLGVNHLNTQILVGSVGLGFREYIKIFKISFSCSGH